jgi:DNA-binding transcriptional MerR regulator
MKEQQQRRYGIKIVAKQTGLSPHVIRIWEKRYTAVSPERTETNRRLYSEDDIARLQLLHDLTHSGHAIGQIAQLPTQNLKAMLRPFEKIVKRAMNPAGEQTAQSYLEVCLTAVKQLDAEELELALTRAAVTLSQPVLIEQLVVPLMRKIGGPLA